MDGAPATLAIDELDMEWLALTIMQVGELSRTVALTREQVRKLGWTLVEWVERRCS